MIYEFHPVTRERWKDFEHLFECKGSPHFCWCTVWRDVKKKGARPDKSEKKASMKARINKNIPVGILAYVSDEPVAWCSIAPKETYRELGGEKNKEGIWSVVCFFIKRPYRKSGLNSLLLKEAIKYAKVNGAKFVESYPVDPDSSSYWFMGFKSLFENARFKYTGKAGKRRNVMLLEL